MKKQFYIGALSLMASIAQADVYPSIHEGKEVDASGFECADSAMHVMDILGRGPDFPNFIISDVESELNRQNTGAHLLSIKCVGEPKLMANSNAVDSDNSQKVLATLSLTFPLQVEVKNGNNIMALEVEQNYTVEGLDTGTLPNVTQNFIVKSSQ
jgi:hypothetical protein